MAAATASLPILAIVGRALGQVPPGLSGIVRLVWAYYALAAALLLAAAWTGPETGAFLGQIAALVLAIAGVAAGVRWLRHLILGEPLDGTAHLDRHVVRSFLRSLLVWLVSALPLAAAGIGVGLLAGEAAPPGGTDVAPGLAGWALLAAAAILAAVLFLRLALYPAAAALGVPGFGLRAAWEATRGRTAALLGIFLLGLVVASILAIPGLILALAAEARLPTAMAAATLVGAVFDTISAILAAGVTAGIWRHLIPEGAGSAPPRRDPA